MPMAKHLSKLLCTVLLLTSTMAHGQGAADGTVLPIWDPAGRLEGLLLLEPSARAGARWRFGDSTLDATFGLEDHQTLGLICDRQAGGGGLIGQLSSHCLLAARDPAGMRHDARFNIGATLADSDSRLGVTVGHGSAPLPAWLSPNRPQDRIKQNTLTVHQQTRLGNEATVVIGGAIAHARLVDATERPDLAQRWNSGSLMIGAGYGDFTARIVGRVIDGEKNTQGNWETIGLGVTWRTPWSGQLTVGAENVVTRGKNPFALDNGEKDDGVVPYVRYEQDL